VLRKADAADPLRHWGEAVAKRRGKRIAVIAIARRLSGILFAMWRDGTVYDPLALGRAEHPERCHSFRRGFLRAPPLPFRPHSPDRRMHSSKNGNVGRCSLCRAMLSCVCKLQNTRREASPQMDEWLLLGKQGMPRRAVSSRRPTSRRSRALRGNGFRAHGRRNLSQWDPVTYRARAHSGSASNMAHRVHSVGLPARRLLQRLPGLAGRRPARAQRGGRKCDRRRR
jgi:hypothetical protein